MRHRIALAVATTTALALPLTACGGVQKAMDCANTAVTVADSVDELQQAASDGVQNPEKAQQALDRIDKNLDKISKETGDAEVEKAVGDLRRAVDDARTSVEQGKAPDLSPVTNAAEELTQVCTPG